MLELRQPGEPVSCCLCALREQTRTIRETASKDLMLLLGFIVGRKQGFAEGRDMNDDDLCTPCEETLTGMKTILNKAGADV